MQTNDETSSFYSNTKANEGRCQGYDHSRTKAGMGSGYHKNPDRQQLPAVARNGRKDAMITDPYSEQSCNSSDKRREEAPRCNTHDRRGIETNPFF